MWNINSKAAIRKMDFILVFIIFLDRYYCAHLDDKCMDYSRDIHMHHPTKNLDSFDVYGKWISSRCELLPSQTNNEAKYIVRRLDLVASAKWNGYFYHYFDSWCTKPKFIVKVSGNYDIFHATATPNSQPTKASMFKFSKVYLRVKEKDVLDEIFNYVIAHCPSVLPGTAKLRSVDLITVNVEDYIDRDVLINVTEILAKKKCRYYFSLHPYSYQKIRMVRGKTKKSIFDSNIEHDVLFFADVPPKNQQLSKYLSEEFQYGLSRLNNPDCVVCQTVNKLKDANVEPILSKTLNKGDFTGSWVSPACEAASGTQFQTRYYKIFPKVSGKDYGEIYSQVTNFNDPDCREKASGLLFGGVYADSKNYKVNNDIKVIAIKYTSLSLTPYDESTLGFLKLEENDSCGDSSEWVIGNAQNVTSSGGCSASQIKLPLDYTAVIRVVNNKMSRELYINQEAGGKIKYFTKSLVACNSLTKDIVKVRSTKTPDVIVRTATILPNLNPDGHLEKSGKPNANDGFYMKFSNFTVLSLLFFTMYWNI